MRKIFLIFAVSVVGVTNLQAQDKPSHFLQVTTIESVVGAGVGRSKIVITKEDGSQEERDLENLFSLTGINFKNIKENENKILQTLKAFTESGWKLSSTVPLTLSPGNN